MDRAPAPAPPLDLDALRRSSGLRLDRDGRWWHRDALVEHPRVSALFDRGLRVDEAGEVRLVVGEQWCYVGVEETAFVVRRARDEADGSVTLVLNDGSEEPLDPATLLAYGHRDLYSRVKGGRCPARLLRDAYHHVALRLEPAPDGGWCWRDGCGLHPVQRLAAPPGPVWREAREGA